MSSKTSEPRRLHTATGLDIYLYPNVLEIWREGERLIVLTPAEYGTIMRWINDELHDIASEDT